MPERKPPSEAPVTLADIAARMGVSKATVSVALRGKPGVSRVEAERIRKGAEAMGYRQNPLVGVHMAHVRNSRAPRYRATLAWIDCHPRRLEPADNPGFCEGRAGAAEEAARLGFRLDEFHFREAGMSPERLSRVLLARNITGVIVAPLPHSGGTLDLAWEHFSAVALGYSLSSPRLHIVSNCQRHTLQEALARLRGFGYRRIGTVINEEGNMRVNRAWTSAFWDDHYSQPASRRLRPLLFHHEARPLTPEAFVEWFKKERPDAVISEDFLAPVLAGLKRLRLRPGRDVALAVRSAVTGDAAYAGVNQRAREVGAAAVASVAGMFQRNERGVPALPQQLLLEGAWQSGASVNERGPGRRPRAKR